MLFSAKMEEILESMPISEKPSMPSILKALQPSSRSVVFRGTREVGHTKDFSFVDRAYIYGNSVDNQLSRLLLRALVGTSFFGLLFLFP